MKKLLKRCNFCENKVPKRGQCNKCGFIDGLARMPTPEEFLDAQRVNEESGYSQYRSIDHLVS